MDESEIIKHARTLIGQYDAMHIIGPGWSGNSRLGFMFNPEIGGPSGAGGAPIIPNTGGCCFCDGTCTVETNGQCLSDGGVYQGDGTPCNPCVPTGACCDDAGDCTVTTEADCVGAYQGDCSVCDPNPCLSPCPCGGFFNPDDGLYYRIKVHNWTVDNSNCPPGRGVSCIGPGIIGCHPPDYCHSPLDSSAPAIVIVGTRLETVIATEDDCGGTTTEDLTIGLASACRINTNDCLTGGGVPTAENCAIDTPDCVSENGCAEDFSGCPPPACDCSIVSETITYEDPCTP